jgi:hypothetical protein
VPCRDPSTLLIKSRNLKQEYKSLHAISQLSGAAVQLSGAAVGCQGQEFAEAVDLYPGRRRGSQAANAEVKRSKAGEGEGTGAGGGQ